MYVTCTGVSVLVSDELWRLCLTTLEWTLIEVPPDGVRPRRRFGHVMTSVGLDLWVHGGDSEVISGEGVSTRASLL